MDYSDEAVPINYDDETHTPANQDPAVHEVVFGKETFNLREEVQYDEETGQKTVIVVPKPWWANQDLLISMFLFNFVFIGAMVFADLESVPPLIDIEEEYAGVNISFSEFTSTDYCTDTCDRSFYVWEESLYFICTTLTTLGYGDILPSSTASKVVLSLYAFFGLGSVAWGISKVASYSQAKVKAAMARLTVPRGSADPFVHIGQGKPRGWFQGAHRTSRVYKATLNPDFLDDDWELPLSSFAVDQHGNRNNKLTFQIYDWDRLGANDLIGTCSLNLKALLTKLSAGEWTRRTMPIVSQYGNKSTFTVDLKKKDEDTLTVRLIKARNLPVVDVEVAGAEAAEAALNYSRNMIGALLSLTCILLLGGLIFALTEEWDYGDALYFSFITATTIGYGDFSPVSVAGRILWFPYIFVALGVGAYVLSTVQDAVYMQTTKRLTRGLGAGTLSRDIDRADMTWQQRHKLLIEPCVAFCVLIIYLLVGTIFIVIDPGVLDEEASELAGKDVFVEYTFLDGLYFSVVTLTTVGYGDILPHTPGSKAWVILYSLFGLGIVSSTVGVVVGSMTESAVGAVNNQAADDLNKLNNEKINLDARDDPKKSGFERIFTPTVRFYSAFLTLLLTLGAIVCIGAAIFQAVEPETWDNYGDAVYFTVITITTIGYGDYYPVTNGGKWFFIFFIFFGLGFYGYAYAQMQAEVERLLTIKVREAHLQRARKQAKLVARYKRDMEEEESEDDMLTMSEMAGVEDVGFKYSDATEEASLSTELPSSSE